MHDARPDQQLHVVRAGAGAHLARRARDLRVRPQRGLHQTPIASDNPEATPERTLRAGAAAGAGQSLRLPARRSSDSGHRSTCRSIRTGRRSPTSRRCTGWPRRWRSSRSGTTSRRSRRTRAATSTAASCFLLTFDLAFQIQEQLRALDAGGKAPAGIGTDPASVVAIHDSAAPPAAAMGDSAGAAVQSAAVARARRHVRRLARRVAIQPRHARERRQCRRPACRRCTACQVINHTPAGYALRQIDSVACAAAHRRPDRLARRGPQHAAGRDGALVPQHAARQRPRIRLRAAHRQSGGGGGARRRRRRRAASAMSCCCPTTARTARRRWRWCRQARFSSSRRSSCAAATSVGTVVLTKLVDQGPGFELFEFMSPVRNLMSRGRDGGSPAGCRSDAAYALRRRTLAAARRRCARWLALWTVGAVARAAEARRLVAGAQRRAARLALWPGVARGKRRARQWALLLLPWYFAEGVVRAFSESGRHALCAGAAAALALASLAAAGAWSGPRAQLEALNARERPPVDHTVGAQPRVAVRG